MGSEQFTNYSAIEDVSTAFEQLRESAAWEYGHGGYTGTIAEKGSFITFVAPEGHSSQEAIDALEEGRFVQDKAGWIPPGVVDAYEDKWGPAVAIKKESGGWFFIGWASS